MTLDSRVSPVVDGVELDAEQPGHFRGSRRDPACCARDVCATATAPAARSWFSPSSGRECAPRRAALRTTVLAAPLGADWLSAARKSSSPSALQFVTLGGSAQLPATDRSSLPRPVTQTTGAFVWSVFPRYWCHGDGRPDCSLTRRRV